MRSTAILHATLMNNRPPIGDAVHEGWLKEYPVNIPCRRVAHYRWRPLRPTRALLSHSCTLHPTSGPPYTPAAHSLWCLVDSC